MAQGGYDVPPSDGLAIVHDFFLEAWPGLRDRYDPSKGAVSSYVIGAFVRFARPRIVRNAKWRQHLLPPEELSAALDRTSRADLPDAAIDASIVRRALDTLSPGLRWVLADRLAAGHSEREVAMRFEVSRYKLREACAEALGRLAVAIGEPGAISAEEWPIVRALWSEESTLPEVAERLGLTHEQAKRARQRVLDQLAAAIAEASVRDENEGRTVMTEFCSLWRELLADPRNLEVAQRARAHSNEMLDHVDDCPECLGAAEGTKDPTDVYQALAPSEELSPQDVATLEELSRARQDDDAAVSRAVEDALLPSLGRDLANLDALGPDITPLRLFLALDAVSMLVHRVDRGARRGDRALFMTPGGAITDGHQIVIGPDVIVDEVAHVASLSIATANRLAAEWMPRAARQQRHLFLGLVCEPRGLGDVRLVLSRRDPSEDLLARWRPSSG
jgi:DNA-directed RNA polymerase specialized sigma24 family protein